MPSADKAIEQEELAIGTADTVLAKGTVSMLDLPASFVLQPAQKFDGNRGLLAVSMIPCIIYDRDLILSQIINA